MIQSVLEEPLRECRLASLIVTADPDCSTSRSGLEVLNELRALALPIDEVRQVVQLHADRARATRLARLKQVAEPLLSEVLLREEDAGHGPVDRVDGGTLHCAARG